MRLGYADDDAYWASVGPGVYEVDDGYDHSHPSWWPPLIKESDPELERLLDEEERIAREQHAVCCASPEPPDVSNRGSMLAEADSLVNGARNAEYGDPIQDFRRTGIYWSTHAGGVLRRKLNSIGFPLDKFTEDIILDYVDNLFDPHDVAIMMTQLKASRLAWSPEKRDHWVDAAGYSACGYDCSVLENQGA